MTKYEWLKIREIEDLIDIELEVDDLFLHGKNMIGQKNSKIEGQQITYFKVLKSKGKNMEYVQVFDVLKEDVINAKKRN